MLFVNEQLFENGQKISDKTLYTEGQEHQMIKPHIPIEFWEMMHDFSMFLIVDDRHDLGRFDYYGRNDHYYRFRKSPDHPSPFHHYQLGILGLVVSQVGALVSKALDIKNEMAPQKEIPHHFKKIIDIEPQQQHPSLPPPPTYQNNQTYSKITQALELI